MFSIPQSKRTLRGEEGSVSVCSIRDSTFQYGLFLNEERAVSIQTSRFESIPLITQFRITFVFAGYPFLLPRTHDFAWGLWFMVSLSVNVFYYLSSQVLCSALIVKNYCICNPAKHSFYGVVDSPNETVFYLCFFIQLLYG
jgi:hypothetical protein